MSLLQHSTYHPKKATIAEAPVERANLRLSHGFLTHSDNIIKGDHQVLWILNVERTSEPTGLHTQFKSNHAGMVNSLLDQTLEAAGS